MTGTLFPCGNCGRHVFSGEERCPFCSAAHAAPRTALAAAFAITAGLTLTGCPPREVAAVYGGPPPPETVTAPTESAVPPPDNTPPPTPPAPTVQPTTPKAQPNTPPNTLAPAYGAPPPPRTERK